MEITLGVEKCGCYIQSDREGNTWIVYCPKHASVPELYEALERISNSALLDPIQLAQIADEAIKACWIKAI